MTDLMLTEEEKLLQRTVRDFVQREVVPHAAEWDAREEFPWDAWRGLVGLGLTGLGVDPAYGGAGGGYRSMAIAAEELARGDAGLSVIYIAHLSLTTQTIYRFSDEAQRRRFVPPLARGERIGAFCLTEPGAGSDAAAMQLRATPRDGAYVLNGTKLFITNGPEADTFAVFCTRDPTLRTRGVLCLVVEKEHAQGFQARKQHGKMGMRASSCAELVFTDTPVPQANRLGEEGQGFRIAMEVLDASRIIIAAQSVGIAQAAYEAAARYATQRTTFGKPIAEHQAIQFMLADMATDIHASRVMTMHAASLKDQGHDFIHAASMAKLFASEAAVRVTGNAVQVFGGYGYFKDAPVERYLRDARVTTIYEGTSQVQRLIIARQLLQHM